MGWLDELFGDGRLGGNIANGVHPEQLMNIQSEYYRRLNEYANFQSQHSQARSYYSPSPHPAKESGDYIDVEYTVVEANKINLLGDK